MSTILQKLEKIGQNRSINDFDTVGQLLAEEGVSEKEINELVNSNIPLVCAWEPEEEEKEKEKEKEKEEDKSLDIKLN